MDFGLVSFIIRVKNIKKKFLQKSLRSALSQTYKNIEIIVVFDKGDPELDKQIWETISEFKNDPRLKLFYREKGRGHIEAMNFGLSKAEGKFIAVLDSDDYCSATAPHLDSTKGHHEIPNPAEPEPRTSARE